MNRPLDKPTLEDINVAVSSHSQAQGRMKDRLLLVGWGTVGGVISAVCCLLPAVAIAIGLTGGLAATLVGLGRFRLYGIVAGLAFVGIASWLSLCRSRTCCAPEEYRRRQIAIPLTMLISLGAFYALVMYLLVPFLYGLR